MRKVLFIALTLTLLSGCDKLKKKKTDAASDSTPSGGVGTVPPFAGGAIQGTRNAVSRIEIKNAMADISTFVQDNSLASGRMPTPALITEALRASGSKAHKLVQDKVIVLTGATKRESIWAYTSQAVAAGDVRVVLHHTGIEDLTWSEVEKRLQMQ